MIAALGADPTQGSWRQEPARGADIRRFAWHRARQSFAAFFLSGRRLTRVKARALANGEDPHGDAATLDVLAALEKFEGARPDAEAFLEALDPLAPRLYSISSSPKANPRQGAADRRHGSLSHWRARPPRRRLDLPRRARRAGRGCEGLCARAALASGCPNNPDTRHRDDRPRGGVAPFRAFSRNDRPLARAGANWPFFGHHHRPLRFLL